MKHCSKCKIEKDESEFYKLSAHNNVLRSHCKQCISLQNKEYHYKNRDNILSRHNEYNICNYNLYLAPQKSEYYINNKPHENERSAKYRVEHPEYFKNYNHTYHLQNIDSIHARQKERYLKLKLQRMEGKNESINA